MKKKGWIRILEATIAAMIVVGVMLVSYSEQVQRDVSVAEYSKSLQDEVLLDIVASADLRLNVLNVDEDELWDEDYVVVDNFVSSKVPGDFGHLVRVCKLGDDEDYCKMGNVVYIATLGLDVFVEETIVAAEIGTGTGSEIFEPKKVKIFFWEGGFPEGFCRDECPELGMVVSCSDDSKSVISAFCNDIDTDDCLEYMGNPTVVDCLAGELCVDGECVGSGGSYSELVCGKKVNDSDLKCIVGGSCDPADGVDGACNLCINILGFDGWVFVGDSSHPLNDIGCSNNLAYCWNWEVETTACELNPSCPVGFEEISSTTCVP